MLVRCEVCNGTFADESDLALHSRDRTRCKANLILAEKRYDATVLAVGVYLSDTAWPRLQRQFGTGRRVAAPLNALARRLRGNTADLEFVMDVVDPETHHYVFAQQVRPGYRRPTSAAHRLRNVFKEDPRRPRRLALDMEAVRTFAAHATLLGIPTRRNYDTDITLTGILLEFIGQGWVIVNEREGVAQHDS